MEDGKRNKIRRSSGVLREVRMRRRRSKMKKEDKNEKRKEEEEK